MNLEIKRIKDVFYLTGVLNNKTLSHLKSHFNYTIDLGPNIILNIAGIKKIDASGMKGLEELYEHISYMNQRLCITGLKFNQLRNQGTSLLVA